MEFEDQGLAGGIWRGVIRGGMPRRVVLAVRGEVVAEARLFPETTECRVEAALPLRVLGEGMQSLLLVADDETQGGAGLSPGGQVLGRLSILAGKALDDDIAAELHQLRAELDLLKHEFRLLARRVQSS